jgi:hypothetical protein
VVEKRLPRQTLRISQIQNGDDEVPLSSGHDVASVVPDSPKMSGNANPDVVRRDDHNNSFLQDSSDNDGKSGKLVPIAEVQH